LPFDRELPCPGGWSGSGFRKEEGMESFSTQKQSKAWEPMTLAYVGDAGELLAGGEGKTSPVPTDPGEIFKEPGHG
jgi:hypothetical protein